MLSRRPVTPTSITYTGPVRKVDEAMAQLITDPDDYRMVKANTQLAPVLISYGKRLRHFERVGDGNRQAGRS